MNNTKKSIKLAKAQSSIFEYCQGCGCTDFSPNIELFEEDGSIVCDACAEAIFEENNQFGLSA